MAITVRDLVALPHLRLEVLSGQSGLDRVVTWAHSSDLDQPWGWLSGGELLMKNGRSLPRLEKDQIAFIEGLISAQTSALVIGSDPQSPPIAAGALRRADDLKIPVLRVPFSMSFIVLSRAVADSRLSEEASRFTRTEKIYDTIHAAVASDDPGMFLARLRVELSCELFVVDSETLNPILTGTSSLPDALRSRIRSELELVDGAIPGSLRFSGARRGEVIVVDIPYEEPTFLVASFPSRQPHDLVLLQHAATAVAVEVAHASLRADYQRQIGTELFSQLIEGRLDSATGISQLRQHNLSISSAVLFAINGVDANDERHLHMSLRRRGIAHLLLRRDQNQFVLLEKHWDSQQHGSSSTVTELVLERLGRKCTIGVSDLLLDPLRTPAAAREALWALAGATGTSQAVNYADASPFPALRSQEEAQALVSRVLGPLIEYDEVHGSDLVYSLTTFLAARRSWQRCAERLHVHRQTVIYRMRRIEQLTGRSLAETGDLAILWLAISAYDALRLGVPTSSINFTRGNHEPPNAATSTRASN